MKTLILRSIAITSLLFTTVTMQAQVFVDGVVYHYTDDNKPVQVTVMEDEQFYQSIETNKAGKFRVRLQPNHYYVLNLSKPDHYITKIAVDTHVPFEVGPEFYTEIPLEADLVRKYIDMDPAVMKKPLSIFSYDAALETFIQDDEYLKEARAQLEAFLYEAEEAEKRSNEELTVESAEKSTKDSDSLSQESKNEENQIAEAGKTDENSLLAQANPDTSGKSTKAISQNNNQDQEEIALHDSKKNEVKGANTSGPSAPQVENQNKKVSEPMDTNSIDSARTNNPTKVKNYSVSIRVNGEEYLSNSTEKMKVTEDLDIDIMGIPNDSYAEFNYRLDGKEDNFKILRDDEVDYEDLMDGDYTFILANNSNDFDEIRVPLHVEKEGSDFPWIFVILGIIVIILIIVFSRKRKTADVEDRRTVDRTNEERNEIDDDQDVDGRV